MVYLIGQVWIGPYLAYLTRQAVPEDPAEAPRIIHRSKAYTVINGDLYKRSISRVL